MGGQLNDSKRGELFFVVNDWDHFRGKVMQVSEENDQCLRDAPCLKELEVGKS